jgi:hypothetical protein
VIRRRVGDGVGGLQLRLLLGHLGQHLAEGCKGGVPGRAVVPGDPHIGPIGEHSGTPSRPDFLAGQSERHRLLLGLVFGTGMSDHDTADTSSKL